MTLIEFDESPNDNNYWNETNRMKAISRVWCTFASIKDDEYPMRHRSSSISGKLPHNVHKLREILLAYNYW